LNYEDAERGKSLRVVDRASALVMWLTALGE
jgi:hypothetical protein